jgi:hypothetical protein
MARDLKQARNPWIDDWHQHGVGVLQAAGRLACRLFGDRMSKGLAFEDISEIAGGHFWRWELACPA